MDREVWRMSISIQANGTGMFGMNPAAAQEAGKTGKNTVFAGNSFLAADPIEQRRQMAQKRAFQVVSDAWENEKSIQKEITSREEHYAAMQMQKKESQEELRAVHEKEKELQELYHVEDDSEEQKDLELLKKRDDYQNGVGSGLTEDERKQLAEIDKKPRSEYQERALAWNKQAIVQKKLIRQAEWQMQDDVGDIKQILLEKLKSNPMLDAQKTAEELMEAANEDIIGMLTQEAVDHIDEELEEAEEKAEKTEEKKEQEEERQEKIAAERAMERAWIEGTKEAAERAEAKERESEAPDMEFGEIVELAKTNQLSEGAAESLNEIKNSMKLLEADLKGIRVDREV